MDMTHDHGDGQEATLSLDKTVRIKLLWSAGTALFWVIFLWGFWDRGVYALGPNTFVYLAAVIGLFLWSMHRQGIRLKDNLYWIVPIGLIVASFLIYDNPFLKAVSMLVLPVLFALFYNLGFLRAQPKPHWNSRFLGRMLVRALSLLGQLRRSIAVHVRFLPRSKDKDSLVRRVAVGVFILLAISLTVIIPLLSSADAVFAAQTQVVMDRFRELLSTTLAAKILVGIIFSVVTTAGLFAWGRDLSHAEDRETETQTDSVIVGIVLGGILVIYALFLWLQFRKMWVGTLPFDFKETVYLVKSGFWQLLFLSVINIVIYFSAYRKTVPAVQKLLGAFTFASLLLLFSAGHRMVLYVVNYGFSYEKFFALYTVLFCAVLLVWLISRLFVPRRSNILKFLILLFLWMFAMATVFPVERFILSANVSLAQSSDSRIRLYELTMLSPDALGLVRRYRDEGKLKENAYYLDRERAHRPDLAARPDDELQPDWSGWIERQEKIIREKAWYEKGVVNWLTAVPAK